MEKRKIELKLFAALSRFVHIRQKHTVMSVWMDLENVFCDNLILAPYWITRQVSIFRLIGVRWMKVKRDPQLLNARKGFFDKMHLLRFTENYVSFSSYHDHTEKNYNKEENIKEKETKKLNILKSLAPKHKRPK